MKLMKLKILTCVFLGCLLIVQNVCAQEIILKPVFSEGFGTMLKAQVIFQLSVADPAATRAKGYNPGTFIWLLASVDEQNMVLVDFNTVELKKRAVSMFSKVDIDKIWVEVIGYETVIASGVPGMGQSINSDDGIETIAGEGWGLQKIFVVSKFKKIDKPVKK